MISSQWQGALGWNQLAIGMIIPIIPTTTPLCKNKVTKNKNLILFRVQKFFSSDTDAAAVAAATSAAAFVYTTVFLVVPGMWLSLACRSIGMIGMIIPMAGCNHPKEEGHWDDHWDDHPKGWRLVAPLGWGFGWINWDKWGYVFYYVVIGWASPAI